MKRTMASLALASMMVVCTGARANDAVTFPDRSDAWLKEGTFPNVDNVRKMMPGLSKNQVYALLEEPRTYP